MTNNKVISFRASSHFLNWIQAQQLEGESESQTAMRILKALSVGEEVDLSTKLSTNVSTQGSDSFVSTDLSTNIGEIVDTQIETSLAPILQKMAAMEERLGKLRA